MRGVRALWKAPLLIAVAFLATCQFEFSLIEPSIEINAQMAYQSGNKLVLDYKFLADEPALRCKYTVNYANVLLKQKETDSFLPGTWQHLEIQIDNPMQGEYEVQLIAQAQRGQDFVDLTFLTKTYDFYLDFENPIEPEFSPSSGLFTDPVQVALSHGEWVGSSGSPVNIYYTTDHSNPTASSSVYIAGSPIIIDVTETPTEIRAIAIDDSGRQSDIRPEIYRFISIDHTHFGQPDGPINEFETSFSPQFIYIHGYGLDAVQSAEFFDFDGTSASTVALMGAVPKEVILAVSFPTGIFIGDGTTTDGTLRLLYANGVIEKEINLVPEPSSP